LGDVMIKMNFSLLWRKWILECVTIVATFVHVNVCPTKEFKKERRLHQGDHLSPFLLTTKGLKVMMNVLVEVGLFTGFGVARMIMCLSLIYTSLMILCSWGKMMG